jgi:drug/metabolite transporter (DMT)-like permease
MPKQVLPPRPGLVLCAFAAVYLIWGSTYLAIRYALETLPPFLMAGTRFLAAGLVMYAWMRWRGARRPTGLEWRSASLVGGLLLLGGNGGVVWAQQRVPSGLAALLVSLVSVWMVLLNWALPGRPSSSGPGAISRPAGRESLGLALGLAGVALLVGPRTLAGAPRPGLAGVAVLLFASGAWALGSVLSRRLTLPDSHFLSTGMEMMAGGVMLLLVGLAAGEPAKVELANISARSAFSWLYLILFGSLVGFTAYVWLLQVTTPARVATYAYVNPVVAVLLGRFLARETLDARTGLAALLIIAGVALLVIQEKKKLAAKTDQETQEAAIT